MTLVAPQALEVAARDLIIFPDDIEYKKVPQCTTGRVYILKFKSSSRKFFFWMQEPKTDKDEEYCTKVNESLNNPPTPGSSRSNVSTQPPCLRICLISAAGPAVQLSDLQSILSNMNVPQPAEAGAGGEVDLSSAMTAEALQPVLSNPAFLERLQQFLPSIGNNEQLPPAQNLRGTLQSPQFQQALSLFSSALQSGQLAPVIGQFDLGDAAVSAAAAGDLGAFVRALQEQGKKDDDMATE
ncbi:proteasomal ubiquitin receptor ADRM1-A-like [Pollicipes pollicipes]|uniref:proteasomal ubiquitin receptor ADRM1-A-like n=1 Tax=Pollicipes pollicipes TaxID=41117 RepID=UPI001885449E|nr:proteasomal ubiquitin receptor ADRM1-A-like [Pollicipes pollicipes]